MITYLKWDSEFFGKKIARIDLGYDTNIEKLQKTIDTVFDGGYDCGYLMIAGDKAKMIAYCKQNDYFLADKKLVMRKRTHIYKSDNSVKINTESSKIKLNELEKIACQIAETSRFYKDPYFKQYAYKLYKIWILRSLKRDKCFFAVNNNGLTGLITVKVIHNSPYIDLFGVDSSYRKRGIGTALLETADNWVKESDYRNISVTTQADNNVAFLVYKKHGFKQEKLTYIFHIWNKHDKNPL